MRLKVIDIGNSKGIRLSKTWMTQYKIMELAGLLCGLPNNATTLAKSNGRQNIRPNNY